MSLSALADLGDFIAAIAVIVSLIYLAFQVRHASAVSKATAYREIHQDLGQVFGDVMINSELHRIWRSGLVNGEQLTDDDREKLGMILFRIFGALEYGHHSRWLDPSLDEYVNTVLNGYLELSAVQGWWSRQGHLHPKPFRTVVDTRLKELRAKKGSAGAA